MITVEQLRTFAPNCDATAVAPALDAAAVEAMANTPARLCHFLAQWTVESGGFTRMAENLNYSAEALLKLWPNRFTRAQAAAIGRTSLHGANQMAIANAAYGGRLGNVDPGDGWTYRGRGWSQLTGRANYAAASEALDVDLVGSPELAATPAVAGRICAWYWRSRHLNDAADRDDIETVTRGVNGGLNGLADRRAALARARAIWGR